ncbi:protein phosphatase 2C domain-containing protein [Leucobacter allii]|uniref:Protein phosphatase 2C domain-containing protein n=1 Tax=Leucobacter allii TaxID=2932247 RepID=A0ABY4FN02_9MICO|nr:protein phosphatase 2C domain-containing protein [Leucobacter allii]UOQ57665.1 protein phosphatase 2C domain-containing protein [Leucobacter allii]
MVRHTEPELSFAVRSDVGRRREVNEDAALAAFPCFLVADGMGGHEAGDEASAAAIAAFTEAVEPGRPATVKEALAAIDAARHAVDLVAASKDRGAGCTLTGAVLVQHQDELCWLVVNVGDSRVYLHRGAELHQITVDHSLRDELIAGGEWDESRLPGRNVISRALGSVDSTPDTWLLPVEDGARLLICSDGLTTEVGDDQLRAALTMGGRAEAVVDELVLRANDAGGRDNVTVLVVDVLSGGRPWHVGSGTGSATLDDSTLTATVPRRA